MSQSRVVTACVLMTLPFAVSAVSPPDQGDIAPLRTQVKQLEASARGQKNAADALAQEVQQLQLQAKTDQQRLHRKNQRIENLRSELATMSDRPAPAASS